MGIKDNFINLWTEYFEGADLPLVFYYTDDAEGQDRVESSSLHRCLIGNLAKVRKGTTLCLDADSIGCAGGRRYLGFAREIRPDFEYFLSCGIPGEFEGERYKKSPELVKKLMEKVPKLKAPARFIIFKRWDMLEKTENPEVVIFFAQPDILSGLFTLANFDEADPNEVFAPFCAGCASIVMYPYLEKAAKRPRCVLGMLDVSARPYVGKDVLTFSIPINKFTGMVENMKESFLVTSSWRKINARIRRLKQSN